jgi:hypothetical protein
MMGLWIIGAIVVYLLIGTLLNVVMVNRDIIDPYDDEGAVLAVLMLWLPILPLAILLVAEQQLIKYLRGLKK